MRLAPRTPSDAQRGTKSSPGVTQPLAPRGGWLCDPKKLLPSNTPATEAGREVLGPLVPQEAGQQPWGPSRSHGACELSTGPRGREGPRVPSCPPPRAPPQQSTTNSPPTPQLCPGGAPGSRGPYMVPSGLPGHWAPRGVLPMIVSNGSDPALWAPPIRERPLPPRVRGPPASLLRSFLRPSGRSVGPRSFPSSMTLAPMLLSTGPESSPSQDSGTQAPASGGHLVPSGPQFSGPCSSLRPLPSIGSPTWPQLLSSCHSSPPNPTWGLFSPNGAIHPSA